MSSWLELLKAAASLLLLTTTPPPQKKRDILQKRARRCLGWSQQGKERMEMIVGGQEGFLSFPECGKTSLYPEEGRQTPLLGHCSGMGKAGRDRLLGKGEKGSAGRAGPLPAPLEKCRAVGGQA